MMPVAVPAKSARMSLASAGYGDALPSGVPFFVAFVNTMADGRNVRHREPWKNPVTSMPYSQHEWVPWPMSAMSDPSFWSANDGS